MNDSTRGTMQRLIYTHLCLFRVDLTMLHTVLFSFHLSIIDVLPASVTYLGVSSVLSVACSRCYAHSCLAEWRSCVLVTMYFQMQGDKGDRGPMMRPKVRRFVVMKGDPGPPGTKGTRHDKNVYVIHCKNLSLAKATVVIRLLDRKANVVLPVYREGKTKNSSELIDIVIVLLCSSPGQDGQNGRNGIDGIRGEMGFQGPPGRKVSLRLTTQDTGYWATLFVLVFQGDRGIKGEPGLIQKVDFNSTHLVMMGPPGLPGPKVSLTVAIRVAWMSTFCRDALVCPARQATMAIRAIEASWDRWWARTSLWRSSMIVFRSCSQGLTGLPGETGPPGVKVSYLYKEIRAIVYLTSGW